LIKQIKETETHVETLINKNYAEEKKYLKFTLTKVENTSNA